MDNKKIIIYNKFYKLNKLTNKAYFHYNGDALNSERVTTIVDAVLSSHIKAKNKLLNFWSNFLFYNNDYRKQRDLANKKVNWFRMFNSIFLWVSIIGLIICLIFGIAIPIFNATSDSLLLVKGNYTGSIVANNQVLGWVVSQSDFIAITNALNNKLVGLTINSDYSAFFASNPDLTWFKYFIEEYFGKKMGLSGMAAVIAFRDFLATHVFNDLKFISFNENFQVMAYFKIVYQSINIESMQPLIQQIISSWNGSYFVGLPETNIFYELTSENIFLTGNKFSQAMLVPKIWATWFKDAKVIVPLVFMLVFIFIIVVNYYVLKKNKIKYTSMALLDYMNKKANFVWKWKILLHKIVFLNNKIPELQHNIIDNFDKLTNTDIYNILRLVNFMYSCVESMNIVLVMNYSEEWKNNLTKLCNEDITNLRVEVVDNVLLKEWCTENNEKVDTNKEQIRQYTNYVQSYLNSWQQINQKEALIELSKKIAKQFEQNKLSNEQIDEIVKNIKNNKEFMKLNNKTFNWLKISIKTRNLQLMKIINKVMNDEYVNS